MRKGMGRGVGKEVVKGWTYVENVMYACACVFACLFMQYIHPLIAVMVMKNDDMNLEFSL